MLKKMKLLKNVAKKEKALLMNNVDGYKEMLLVRGNDEDESSGTPVGYFAIYVGEERKRFVVPTSYLAHPLLKILLDKACHEFGFDQSNGLVLPCSVSTFQEVVNAVETNHGKFDMRNFFQEFV